VRSKLDLGFSRKQAVRKICTDVAPRKGTQFCQEAKAHIANRIYQVDRSRVGRISRKTSRDTCGRQQILSFAICRYSVLPRSGSMATEPGMLRALTSRVVRSREWEEALHKSRYVVMNQNGGWQVRNASRHVASTFPSTSYRSPLLRIFPVQPTFSASSPFASSGLSFCCHCQRVLDWLPWIRTLQTDILVP
jgi:hypothetical protein